MYDLIVFLPLLGFLIAGLFGRQIGVRASELTTTGLLAVSALLAWVAFFSVGLSHDEQALVVPVANWLTSGKLAVAWALRIDTLTAVMLVVVGTVSFLVHVYSIGYMAEDPSRPRFFAYLSLFTFAMLMLVTADNLVQMFFGWEGVGLASYLLIGFWYDRPAANAAAIKAAMGKSAQFLLHTWLPDAMEGPTPVSALIHAATMVTAGVFMVARLSPLFDLAPVALAVVTIVGATTAFFAATVGLVQNDIKRVIAYSTCSQLGYMFVGLGVGGYSLGIFHLFTHAFFKALLFLCAGSVITAMHHEQDMRAMGGLRKEIPVTFWMMMIGTLALTGVGIPFTSIGFAGFVSKDAIIEASYASTGFGATYAFVCVTLAAALTAFYSWRLVFMTFFGQRGDWAASPQAVAHGHDGHAHGDDHAHSDDHGHGDHAVRDSPQVMLVPLGVLALGAVVAGVAFRYWFIGGGYEGFWKHALFVGSDNKILETMEHVPAIVSLAPTLMMLIGFAVAYYMYIVDRRAPKALADANPALYRFLLNKWYFDELYDFLFVRPAFRIGRAFWKGGDGALIDGLGPDGISARVLDFARGAVRLQTGYVYHYAFAMLLGVAIIATWYLFGGIR